MYFYSSFAIRISLILLFLSLFTGSLCIADWLVFHGPNGDNRSTETGLLKQWSEDGPPLLWTAEGIGEGISGYASVTVSDGRIFTSGNLNDESVVYALDETNGKILWTYANGPAWTDVRYYHGTRSTPTVDGDRVYDESPHGQLVCLDVKTGKPIWDMNLITEFDATNIEWGFAESVIIDGDKLICCPCGKKGSVVALDKMTGKPIWVAPDSGHQTSYTTPRIIEQDGLRIVLKMDAKGLLAVNAENGEILFHHEFTHRVDLHATMPQYENGHLLLATSGGGNAPQTMCRLKLIVEETKAHVEEIWSTKGIDNLHDSLFLDNGYIYGSTHFHKNGEWICIRLEDGEVLWENREGGRGALTVAEDLIYRMLESGEEMSLLEMTPDRFHVISKFKLPEQGEGPYWAHPVVCNKKLYIRRGQFLHCYDIAE